MDKMNARKKAARAARLRKQRTRRALLTLCLMLAVAVVSVGGTIAWLTDKTDTVENTFSVGDINIELKEHDYDPATNTLSTTSLVTENKDYKIVPGKDLPKDPFVTVKANSEACYLFVKVEATGWTNDKIAYTIDSAWTELNSAANSATGTKVYYREVSASTADQPFYILANNKVIVSKELTKTEIEAITDDLSLKFTAYAVQKEGSVDAAAAWDKIPANQK